LSSGRQWRQGCPSQQSAAQKNCFHGDLSHRG